MSLGTMDKFALKFKRADNGFCRVYYTRDYVNPTLLKRQTLLYCLQQDSGDAFTLYRCSRDGEPEYSVSLDKVQGIEPPSGDTSTEKELCQFLATWNQ